MAEPSQNRRMAMDRRIGERRLRLIEVLEERRGATDRRRRLDRREGAADHLRNALQMLGDLLARGDTDGETEEVLDAVAGRVGLALNEVERLMAARSYLGQRLRVQELLSHGVDPTQVEILFPPEPPRTGDRRDQRGR